MPLYEYHCAHCGENTELLQKVSDEPAVTCPTCHQNTLAKQISSTHFQLKGGGWYATDFKAKKESTASDESKPAESAAKKDTSSS